MIPRPTIKDAGVQYRNAGRVLADYASLSDFVTDCQLADVDGTPQSRKPARKDWDLALGFDGAVRATVQGDTSVLARVEPLARRLAEPLAALFSAARTWATAPEGEVWRLDVPTYLTGDPEYFAVTQAHGGGAREVHINVNTSASASVNAEHIFRRGAVVGALVKALADAGHTPVLTGGWATENSRVSWPQPPDLHSIGFWLCHPAMLRRIGFSWIEHHQPWLLSESYGGPHGEEPEDTHGMDLAFGSCLHGPMERTYGTDEAAEAEALRLAHLLAERFSADSDPTTTPPIRA